MTTLDSVVSDISQKKKTGMLSAMVKVSKQLFKIYFADGEIYHLFYGNRKNSDCFSDLEKIEFSDCFFFSGAKSNTSERINIPTSEIIRRLKDSNKSVVCKDMGEGAVPEGFQDFAALRDKLKAALIRQIGPVGDIVFSKAVEKWTASSSPTKQGLGELVNLLKEEIDDPKNRAEFVSEADKIIS
jgi:hypothetical protein